MACPERLLADLSSKRFARSGSCWEKTIAKGKGRKTEAERQAWDAHVDETLRRLRTLLEKAQAELDAKQQLPDGR
jgi:hypothetical protein